ncbi:pentatricopeptide repeat-containing protein PNM1, mitochondrial [Macadamia integrifolia]|uniref:pentatricopeptide repeat-containing protein PNM1, mitochondrial n=1 Tax=Macadamia integrifolia TaxID=60698 RepID=UPI001C4EFCF0|nr:pentatricopeptide repeat-containing protein PNM1, mitochondrial [Macadamia integrifolia]
MSRPPSMLTALQLRKLLLRCFSSSARAHELPQPPTPLPLLQRSSLSSLLGCPLTRGAHDNLPHPFFPSSRTLETQPSRHKGKVIQDEDQIAQAISQELKDPNTESLSLNQRLDLHFSHIRPTPSLLLRVLNQSPDAGRTALGFHQWLSIRPGFKQDDETTSYLVDYLGRRKDFKAIHDVLVKARGVTGCKTLASSIDRLVRAGRPTQAVSFFQKAEVDYGFVRDRESLKLVLSALCEHGFASYAEKMVKDLANEFFPDESICDLLIKGWCVDGKIDEARRLAGEIYRGGFELGPMAYNAMLDCVCKLCRLKDPFRLQSEAEKVLLDMDIAGLPRNAETFNVLITNLCKIRKTSDALNLFDRMGEWGCSPDCTTFLVLTRSLYQAARIGEGDEMIDRMKSAGYGVDLDRKAYYGFLKILCGIERIEHAMKIFKMMKQDGCKPGIKSYDLLMGKLCAHGMVDRANALFNEAKRRGLPVTPKVYKLDARFAKKPKVKKSEKLKRLTLPEKMALKRKRLRKLRLSFVKKPKKMMRRAY